MWSYDGIVFNSFNFYNFFNFLIWQKTKTTQRKRAARKAS